MSKIHGLKQRGTTYWYRRRVPDDVIDGIGKKEIHESLKTKDYEEAKKRVRLAAVKWDARFDEVRMAPSGKAPLLSRDDALRLVHNYVARMDAEWEVKGDDRSGWKADEKRELEIELDMSIQALQESNNPDSDQGIYDAAVKVLQADGRRFEDHHEDWSMFYEIVRRGLLELYRRDRSRLKGDFSHPFFDNRFAPPANNGVTASDLSFGELCDQFLENYRLEARHKKTSKQRVVQVEARLGVVREIIGNDKSVGTINYDDCIAFRNTLATVPKNRNLKGAMSLDDIIVLAEVNQSPLLSYETQFAYLRLLTMVLTLAKKKQLIFDVFSEDIPPNATKVANRRKRDPLSNGQIRDFFQSDFYATCAKKDGPPYRNAKLPWRYWLPLICAFMGMRPKEVCQMRLSDVKTTAAGTPYFHIIATDDEDDALGKETNAGEGGKKTTKTATSRRKIPIHPVLVNLGILEFHKEQKRTGESMFLPKLPVYEHGNRATYALKRFREKYLPDAIKLTKKQTFYSFRHSFRDALRRIEATPAVLQAVGGWSQGNLVSDDYGDGYGPDQLLKYVKQISYPGVDLSHLYVKPDKGG